MIWPSVNPGELRHRLQIQQQSSTPDAVGQLIQTWNTVWSGWASIRSLTLRELEQVGQLTSQVTHLITVRFPANVNVYAGMRCVYGSHVYQIQAPDNTQELNIWLRLLCLELNAIQ